MNVLRKAKLWLLSSKNAKTEAKRRGVYQKKDRSGSWARLLHAVQVDSEVICTYLWHWAKSDKLTRATTGPPGRVCNIGDRYKSLHRVAQTYRTRPFFRLMWVARSPRSRGWRGNRPQGIRISWSQSPPGAPWASKGDPYFNSQGLSRNFEIILSESERTETFDLHRHQEIQNRPIRVQNTDL